MANAPKQIPPELKKFRNKQALILAFVLEALYLVFILWQTGGGYYSGMGTALFFQAVFTFILFYGIGTIVAKTMKPRANGMWQFLDLFWRGIVAAVLSIIIVLALLYGLCIFCFYTGIIKW